MARTEREGKNTTALLQSTFHNPFKQTREYLLCNCPFKQAILVPSRTFEVLTEFYALKNRHSLYSRTIIITECTISMDYPILI